MHVAPKLWRVTWPHVVPMFSAAPMLVCTATAFEAHACAMGLAQVPEARKRFEVLHSGMGMTAARRALKARLRRGPRPWAVVSTGIAGSVQEDLAVGAWVMGTQVVAEDAAPIALSDALGTLWHRAGITCRARSFRTVSGITLAACPHAPHATVVDMETYAWAEVAMQHQVPCAALRVISDNPQQPLPGFVTRLTALTQTPRVTKKAAHMWGAVWNVVQAPQGALSVWRHSQALARAITDTWCDIAQVAVAYERDGDDGAWRAAHY